MRRSAGRANDRRIAIWLTIALPAVPIGPIAAVIGRTTVITRSVISRTAVIAVIIIVPAVLGRGDRKAGADDTGKGCRGGCTASPVIGPAAGADVGHGAGRNRALAFRRAAREGRRRLDRRQRQRRDRSQRRRPAGRRKSTRSNEHP